MLQEPERYTCMKLLYLLSPSFEKDSLFLVLDFLKQEKKLQVKFRIEPNKTWNYESYDKPYSRPTPEKTLGVILFLQTSYIDEVEFHIFFFLYGWINALGGWISGPSQLELIDLC